MICLYGRENKKIHFHIDVIFASSESYSFHLFLLVYLCIPFSYVNHDIDVGLCMPYMQDKNTHGRFHYLKC